MGWYPGFHVDFVCDCNNYGHISSVYAKMAHASGLLNCQKYYKKLYIGSVGDVLNAILAKPIVAHRHVPSLYCYACAVFKAHEKKAMSIVCGCFTIGHGSHCDEFGC